MKIALIIPGLVVVIVAALFIYYGGLRRVEFSITKLGGETLVYVEQVGNTLEDPDPAILEKLKGRYNIKTLPEKEYIVTEFPFRGKISIMMGIMKVYPAMNRFVSEKGFDEDGWVMEIYDIPGKKIVYRKEMVKR